MSPKGDAGTAGTSAVEKNKDIVEPTAPAAPAQATIVHVSLYQGLPFLASVFLMHN